MMWKPLVSILHFHKFLSPATTSRPTWKKNKAPPWESLVFFMAESSTYDTMGRGIDFRGPTWKHDVTFFPCEKFADSSLVIADFFSGLLSGLVGYKGIQRDGSRWSICSCKRVLVCFNMFFGTGLIWINRLKRSEKGKTCIEENLPLNQLKILQNRADGGTVRLRNAQLQRLHYAVEMPRATELDVAGGLFFWGGYMNTYVWMILNLYIIIYIYIYDILLYDYVLFVCGRTCFFFVEVIYKNV